MASQAQANTQSVELDLEYYHGLVELPEGMDICPFTEFVKGNWLSDEQIEKFRENYRHNRILVKPCPRTNEGKGKTVILVGAGPSLKKNVSQLKGLGEEFIIVTSPTTLQFLRERGIKPNYVFAIEGRDHWLKDIECGTVDLTLVATPFLSWKAVAQWQGRILWYMLGGSESYNEDFCADWPDQDFEISGGNAISTALCWSLKYLGARDFIFVGMDLCFEQDYYMDGRKKIDEVPNDYRNAYMAMDIYGKLVSTTPALTMYKTWFEALFKIQSQFDTRFFNCSEGGILGVMPKPIIKDGQVEGFEPVYIPWVSIAPLKLTLDAYKAMFKERDNGARA